MVGSSKSIELSFWNCNTELQGKEKLVFNYNTGMKLKFSVTQVTTRVYAKNTIPLKFCSNQEPNWYEQTIKMHLYSKYESELGYQIISAKCILNCQISQQLLRSVKNVRDQYLRFFMKFKTSLNLSEVVFENNADN